MLRTILCAGVTLVVCVGLVAADEIRAVITKVDNGKITFAEVKGKNERGEARTLPVADNVKVVKGTFNKDTKKLEAGDAIADGLKAAAFTSIGENGLRVTIVTNDDNSKITEIRVGGGRKKKE